MLKMDTVVLYQINGGLHIKEEKELFKLMDKVVIKINGFQQSINAILRKWKDFWERKNNFLA